MKINVYHKPLIIFNSNLGFFRKLPKKEEIWQVLSLNDEIHQDINRKFIIAQDLNNQVTNGQEIERPDTRLALLRNVSNETLNKCFLWLQKKRFKINILKTFYKCLI